MSSNQGSAIYLPQMSLQSIPTQESQQPASPALRDYETASIRSGHTSISIPASIQQCGAYRPTPPIRKATVRIIPLTPQGNLVIDVQVPDRVLQNAKHQKGDEFTHMRYTAVTCPADSFPKNGYMLRQQESNRKTELFIVVTM